jgi:hypothetical protein
LVVRLLQTFRRLRHGPRPLSSGAGFFWRVVVPRASAWPPVPTRARRGFLRVIVLKCSCPSCESQPFGTLQKVATAQNRQRGKEMGKSGKMMQPAA